MGVQNALYNHTRRARRFAAQFPLLNSIMIQVGFWVIAFVLLGLITYFSNRSLWELAGIDSGIRFSSQVLVSFTCGIIYGVALGILDYFFDKEFFHNKPFGYIIVSKSILSLVLLIALLVFNRYILVDIILGRTATSNYLNLSNSIWNNLITILIYTFVATLINNFIIQVNKKFGPGVLVPILLGKYRSPREEERAFLFMDLQSSTTIAEQLGHLQYSSFIRDSFMEINKILKKYDAEIYQYVGDEIVVSWQTDIHTNKMASVDFYFACQQQFENRRNYFIEKYNVVPFFKAGLHIGKVSAVEIGEVKRDIAYHGDTLNIAARIQSMCNQYGKQLLTSSHFINEVVLNNQYYTQQLGSILLKGKTIPVEILSIEKQV